MLKELKRKLGLVLACFSLGLPTTAGADTYTYDAQGRLTSVTYTAGGSVTYTYDAAGNRTQQVKSP